MSDTPRVDSIAEHAYTAGGLRSASFVQAWFARELEREIAALKAEVADLRERLDTAWGDNATSERINASLRAELAALKANDPLAKEGQR